MPLIDAFHGLRLYVFNGDHLPPHIHVYHNEYHAVFDIGTGKVLAGGLPVNKKKLIRSWLEKHSIKARKLFYRLNPDLR